MDARRSQDWKCPPDFPLCCYRAAVQTRQVIIDLPSISCVLVHYFRRLLSDWLRRDPLSWFDLASSQRRVGQDWSIRAHNIASESLGSHVQYSKVCTSRTQVRVHFSIHLGQTRAYHHQSIPALKRRAFCTRKPPWVPECYYYSNFFDLAYYEKQSFALVFPCHSV